MATLDELGRLLEPRRSDRQPANEAGRLLGRRSIRCSTGRRPRRSCGAPRFLRREVVPRREAVLTIAQEIEELNNANLAAQRAEVDAAPRRVPRRPAAAAVADGAARPRRSALVVVVRLRVLEHRSEEAERQMRELSQQLVNTQEEERSNLSRELHDHVAQVLTGLRMELGRVERTERRRSSRRRRRRMQGARRRHVPHGARSRARPAAEHAGRLRPAGGARVARPRFHAPLRDQRRAEDRRRRRRP